MIGKVLLQSFYMVPSIPLPKACKIVKQRRSNQYAFSFYVLLKFGPLRLQEGWLRAVF